jgi:hypothetical protein
MGKKEIKESDNIKKQLEIKGKKKENIKSNSYITLEEKKLLLKQLMSSGLNFEDARERVNYLQRQQTKIRNKLRENKEKESKKDLEIKSKQKKMLKNLWR